MKPLYIATLFNMEYEDEGIFAAPSERDLLNLLEKEFDRKFNSKSSVQEWIENENDLSDVLHSLNFHTLMIPNY